MAKFMKLGSEWLKHHMIIAMEVVVIPRKKTVLGFEVFPFFLGEKIRKLRAI